MAKSKQWSFMCFMIRQRTLAQRHHAALKCVRGCLLVAGGFVIRVLYVGTKSGRAILLCVFILASHLIITDVRDTLRLETEDF